MSAGTTTGLSSVTGGSFAGNIFVNVGSSGEGSRGASDLSAELKVSFLVPLFLFLSCDGLVLFLSCGCLILWLPCLVVGSFASYLSLTRGCLILWLSYFILWLSDLVIAFLVLRLSRLVV